MNILKKNGGFTLVELIVVIAILAILAGVAVPAYSGYIKSANDAAVETELGSLKTAVMAANATKAEITGLSVASDGITVTITTTGYATNFEADFNAYYGITGATLSTNTLKLPSTSKIDFSGSSYEGKTATWDGSEWKAG